MSDPLHQQILDRLAGELNPQTFEDCACDLLRDAFPSLVCVRGGHDSGMDGAVADGVEEAFQLLCTTARDFHRNLAESLDSFVRRGRRPRKAVFATSQEITPERRFSLEDAARERGFTLVQVVDRRGMAQRLYWSPPWLRKLLDLSAMPSALSSIPRSRRPRLSLNLVGREADLEWLRSTPGDRVITGEPGSGKTFLLTHLMDEGWNGLFLVEEDRGEVKRALLAQRPDAVIVDDAHVRLEVLGMLRHLREEMAAGFSIVATTWTWKQDLDTVTAALPDAQLRELRLLPRYQILEILEQAGIQGSDEHLRELVDQAANKPGLAATIAHYWKRGAWQDVLEGRALHREVLASFRGSFGSEVEDLLAALSLGGDRGLGLEPIQRFLGLSRPEVRRLTAALADGGVLSTARDDALSVWPRRLRTSLLRTVFFSGVSPGRELRSLLTETPNFAAATQELAAVRQAGAEVPEIHDLILRAGSGEENAKWAWRLLAGAGEGEARWVLEHYPGDLLDIAYALLEQIPDETIPRILEHAEGEARTGHRESRAMGLLASWVQEPYPAQQEEALRRREQVARAATQFLREGGDLGTGVHGISLALKPNQRGSSRDPGLGNTVKYWSALLPLEGLRRIPALWEGSKEAISSLDRRAMQVLESALWDWMHPNSATLGAEVPQEIEREMRSFALRVLHDLIPLAKASPGLGARLARLAARLDATLPIELDPLFEILYPESYVETEPEREASRQNALRSLATDWARLGPERMAGRLSWYEAEAERVGYSWPRGSQDLCRYLAEAVAAPRPWLQALVECRLASTFVAPFLDRLVRERGEGWEQVVDQTLNLKPYEFVAIDAVLQLPDAPPSLVEEALDRAAAWPTAIETLALRREMPRATLTAALCHPRWEIALAAAVGEWFAGREGGVRNEFLAEWRKAILRAPADGPRNPMQHWLGEILAQDPILALDWLRARLRDPDSPGYFLGGPYSMAVQALRPEQRAELLEELLPVPILGSLLPRLVERNPDLYRRLLARPTLADYHLAPLVGKPDEAWISLALLALDAGKSPEQVAEAAIWGPGSHHLVTGPGIEYWEGWAQAFRSLEDHPRDEIREVGRQGRRIVEHDLQIARSRQEHLRLHGF